MAVLIVALAVLATVALVAKTEQRETTAQQNKSSAQTEVPDQKAVAASVLRHLETKDHFITIKAGTRPLYTIKTKDGKVLAEDLPLEKLRAQYPDVYGIVDGAVAGDGRIMDASLRR